MEVCKGKEKNQFIAGQRKKQCSSEQEDISARDKENSVHQMKDGFLRLKEIAAHQVRKNSVAHQKKQQNAHDRKEMLYKVKRKLLQSNKEFAQGKEKMNIVQSKKK